MADSDWHVSGFVPDSDPEDDVSDLLGTPTQHTLPLNSEKHVSSQSDTARRFVSVLVPGRQDEISDDELAMPSPAAVPKVALVLDHRTLPKPVERDIFDVPSSNPTIPPADERRTLPEEQDDPRPDNLMGDDPDSDDSPLSSVSSSRSSSPLLPYIPFRSSQHIPIESPTLTQLPVTIDIDDGFVTAHPQIRSLRERKAIQLHPYAVEGMLYRQTMHSRGIQAVRLANGNTQIDTQNVQDPGSSSQVDADFIMTQDSQPQDTQYIETLDLRDVVRELEGQVVNGGKRRRLSNWKDRRPSIDLRDLLPGLDEFELPVDEGQEVENQDEHDLPRRAVFKRPPLFANVTMDENDQDLSGTVLPTPISLDSGGAEAYSIADIDLQFNTDQQTDDSTDSESGDSDSEASTAESAVQENLKRHAKRLRGFLPASYVRLDQAEQTRSSKTTNEQRRIRDREKQERLRRLREERAQANQEPIREIAPIFDSDESEHEAKRSRIDRFFSRPVPDISISRSPTRSPPDFERRQSEPVILSDSGPATDDMEDNRIDTMLGAGRQRPTAYQTFLDNDLKVARKRKRRENREFGKKRARTSVDHFHQLKYHDFAERDPRDTSSRLERATRPPLHPISRNLKQPLSRHDQPKTPRSDQRLKLRSHGSARRKVSERHAKPVPNSGPLINHVRGSASTTAPIRKPNSKLQVTRRPAEGSKLTSFVNNFTPTHVAQLEVPRQRHGRVNIPALDQDGPLHLRAFRRDRYESRDARFPDDAHNVSDDTRLMDGNTAQPNAAVEQTVKPRRRHNAKKDKISSRTSLHHQRPLLGPFLDNLSPPPSAYLADGVQIDGDSEPQLQETRSVNLSFRATSTFDVEPLSPGKVLCHGSLLNGDLLNRMLQPHRLEDIDSCFQETWLPADTQRIRDLVTEVSIPVLNGGTQAEIIAGKVKDLVDLLCTSTKDFAQQDSQVQLEIWGALRPLFESYSVTSDLALLGDSDGTVAEIVYIYARVILLLLHVKKSISVGSPTVEVDHLLLQNMKALMRILSKFTQSIKETLQQCLRPDPSSLSPSSSQEKLLEATIVLHHVAEHKQSPSQNIWSLMDTNPEHFATDLSEKFEQHEQFWGFSFLLLPVLTIDSHGVVMETSKRYPGQQGWKALRPLVVDVLNNFELASPSMRKHLLVYIKFLLLRSLHLITTWHWDQCEAIIGTFFDFFARNQLRHLEGPVYPALVHRHVSSVVDNPASVNDHAFLLLLKLIVAAMKEKRGTNEKQIGNLVFRLIPNHGRSYPRDQDIAAQDLDSLQNNHDLLWVLLAFTPKQHRPRLSHFENLVSFQSSHLEACRINVKTWYHCARSMLEQDPTVHELVPLWNWFRTALKCAVEQHRKTRSDVQAEQAELAKAGRPMQQKNVEAQIRRNESSIELILVDMAHAMSETLKTVSSPVFACRFLDCGVVDLLGVGNIQKRDVDTILRVCFDSIQRVLYILDAEKENETADDSQGFGDWSGFEELEGEPAPEQEKAQLPANLERELYALLGKACGSDKCSRSFLEELVMTWAKLCSHNVRKRTANWDDYTGEYASHSWSKLQDTVRSRELGLLFYSEVLQGSSTNVPDLTVAAVQTLLVRLTDPEPFFSYQHVLLNVVLNKNIDNLLDDLPFSRYPADGLYHIGVPELLQCRVAVFASIFSTMHRQLADENRHLYKKYIVSMQASIKVRILEKTTSISDAEFKTYTAFVYRVIELVQEHIPEVAHIDPIFMDSSKFPQLHQDPLFVVSKLKNLARHLSENRSPKQLVSFVFHVLEQALQDGTQARTERYFIDAAETRVLNEKSLQSFLLTEFIAQCVVAVRGDPCGYILIAPLVNAITTLFSRVLTVVNTKDVRHTEAVQRFIIKHCDVLFTAWMLTYGDIKATRNAELRSLARPILAAFERALHHCIDVLVFISKTTKHDLSEDSRITRWRTALADLDKQVSISLPEEDTSNLAAFTRSEARTILDRWSLENGELSIRKGNQKDKIALPAIQVFDEGVERELEALLSALTVATRGSFEDMGWSEREESSWAVSAFLRWEDRY